MAQQIKEVIKQEYVKCAQDPAYFMRKYCVIQHPIQGKIPFDLYDFQEDTLNKFLDVYDYRYEYVLGPADSISIDLTDTDDLDNIYLIDEDGNVTIEGDK